MRATEPHVISLSPGETQEAGRQLGQTLRGGEVILLRGPLGAGKSVFARGVGEALGVTRWRGSPTFVLIHEYQTTPPLYHADLYRLREFEVEDLGLEEYPGRGGVLVVEWADRAPDFLAGLADRRRIDVSLDILGAEERVISLHASEIP